MRSIEASARIVGLLIGTLIFAFVFMLAYSGINAEHQESYRAWIKQTGNLKELTFDEFVALSRSGFFGAK